jgi:hypothetical protein
MRRGPAVIAALLLLAGLPAAAMAAPPANDLPGGATAISAVPTTLTQDTAEATVGADDVGCGMGGLDQATVWYRITPSVDMDVIIDASASSYGVGVNVFAGTATNDAIQTCFEGPGFAGLLAGTTYFLMFADVDAAANGGQLRVSITLAPPALDITLAVASTAKVQQKPGLTVVTGTVTCDREAEFASLESTLTQKVGKYVIRGSGFADTTCGPVPSAWTMEILGDNGRFNSGKATIEVHVFACEAIRCTDVVESFNLRLRR